MMESALPLRESDGFSYVDSGPRSAEPAVVLLHGMIGGAGNWDPTVERLSAAGWRVLVPRLPVFGSTRPASGVPDLVEFVLAFLETVAPSPVVAVGNSLGGHVATLLAADHPAWVAGLVLLGASGVEEVDLGATTLRRYDREFLRERAEVTFFDPGHVTETLLDEVTAVLDDRSLALPAIRLARAVKQDIVADRLPAVTAPTLVAWGRQDRVTPPHVAEAFARDIPGARLCWIDRCGHAPMMERPEEFCRLLIEFLSERPWDKETADRAVSARDRHAFLP